MAARETLVDTSGWLCHFDIAQPQHQDAITFIGVCLAEGRRLITTNYVLAELVALMSSRNVPRPSVIAHVETIKNHPNVDMIHIDSSLDADAWDKLKSRPDKDWSLVDCTSFVVMQQRGMTEALTTDHHFEQAGFIRLLK